MVTGHEEVQARERNHVDLCVFVFCLMFFCFSVFCFFVFCFCFCFCFPFSVLTASLRKSAFSWPGNRRQQVAPERPALTRWFKSPVFRIYLCVLRIHFRTQQIASKKQNEHAHHKFNPPRAASFRSRAGRLTNHNFAVGTMHNTKIQLAAHRRSAS